MEIMPEIYSPEIRLSDWAFKTKIVFTFQKLISRTENLSKNVETLFVLGYSKGFFRKTNFCEGIISSHFFLQCNH